MTHDKRDKAIEAWLRRPQHEVRAGEVDDCPDEETIAAWLEGGLEGQALDRVLTHASMCERCEAIAATILRTETLVPATDATADAAAPWWRRWLAWGVPLTAAATAVVALAVWVRTPVVPSSRPSAPSAATDAARAAADRAVVVPGAAPPAAEAAGGTTASGAAQPANAPAVSESKSEPLVDARANTSQRVTPPSSNSNNTGVPAPQAARGDGFAERKETPGSESLSKSASDVARRSERQDAADEPSGASARDRAVQSNNGLARGALAAPGGLAAETAAPGAPAAVAAPSTAAAPPVVAAAPLPPPPQSAPRPPQPAASADAGSSTADSASARGGATVTLPAATPASRNAGAAGAAGAGAPATGAAALANRVDAGTPWTVVTSSTSRSLWRFRRREIEHSLDGGASWRRVTGDAPEVLLSGVSVSDTVSWYVGERGTVLRVAEDRSTTVPFPQPVDLVSVRATSNLAVVVTTRDGRVFTTSDGGQTWRTP